MVGGWLRSRERLRDDIAVIWTWQAFGYDRGTPTGLILQEWKDNQRMYNGHLLTEPTSRQTSESAVRLSWSSNAIAVKEDRKITLARPAPEPEALLTTHESATTPPTTRSENNTSGTWKGNLDDSSIGTETGGAGN